VKAIIRMAHSMKVSVIAEGVENKNQLGFLRQNRCDEVQGFYFSAPIRADSVPILFEMPATAAQSTIEATPAI
jgi:EAL domain-containing protein (putative c-di-GMP-specific phosphodiesterase class I)